MIRAYQARASAPLAALAVLAVGAAAWPFTIDDAFITAHYAARLASGHGLTVVEGPPTDGVTGPLWLLPGALAALVGLSPIAAQKALGLALIALASALVVRRAAQRQGGQIAAPITALLVVAGPTLGVWGAAGLESGAATLALTATMLGATARPRPNALLVGVCVGLLAWLRPEACAAGMVALAATGARGGRRAGAWAAGIAAVFGVAVVAYRLALFGHVLPLAVQAKPGELAAGVDYVLRGALVTTGGAGLVLAGLAGLRAHGAQRWTLALVGVFLGSVAVAGGDWMPGFRLLAPILPTVALLAGIGSRAALLASRRPLARALLGGALLVALGVPLLDLVVQLPEVRAAGATRERAGRPFARWLGARARRVALVDVGFLPYVGGFDAIDLGGVTEPEVARLAGGHLDKLIDPAWLAERAPDALVLHASVAPRISPTGDLLTLAGYPVERRLAELPWVRATFRVERVVEYAPGYVYVVLLRRPTTGAGGRSAAGCPPPCCARGARAAAPRRPG